MNCLSYCLALYQTWEIPRSFELLLRCLRFPELCPVTVLLPEIFASRRQAVMLIPSALRPAQISWRPSSTICSLGWAANPRMYIKHYLTQKIKINFSLSDRKTPGNNLDFVIFLELFYRKVWPFLAFHSKSRIFYQLYRCTFRIYDKFLSIFSTFSTNHFRYVECWKW